MSTSRLIVVVALPLALLLGNSPSTHSRVVADDGAFVKKAPLLDNLGDHHHPIDTDVPLAQRYFDQGLILAFGFNHAEAARSFREAQRLDPDCAMAYWGEALVLGPNINAPMTEDNVPKAWSAVQKALKHRHNASPRHRRYIKALAKRYSPDPTLDRAELDRRYADAMRTVVEAHPEDYDAQTLFAEALMDTMPWKYWKSDGQPAEATPELLATLERVLARRPNHPLANHLYIHAVEEVHPRWAEACADRLGDLVPGAGHLVHMPSHIYIRVGRYEESNRANELAIESDDSYIAQCHAQGLYPLAYMPHNHHFLWFGKAMTGERDDCVAVAHHIHQHVDQDMMREPGYGTLQHYFTLPLWTYARFEMWDKILAEPELDEDLLYPRGVWHFTRGMALARTGRPHLADLELDSLAVLAANETLDEVTIWDINTTRELLLIAEKVLSAVIAESRGEFANAERWLREAVTMEASLKYTEPPSWLISNRQLLGSMLIKAEKPAAAEVAFRKDLEIYPANGWALHGLYRALFAQGKLDEAAEVERQFQRAWSKSDMKEMVGR